MNLKRSVDDYFDDFGFSAVSEEELKSNERELAQKFKQTHQQLETIEASYKQKLENLYSTIMPLLLNLKKNPEKEYIYWPNRTEKIDEFLKKIESIVND